MKIETRPLYQREVNEALAIQQRQLSWVDPHTLRTALNSGFIGDESDKVQLLMTVPPSSTRFYSALVDGVLVGVAGIERLRFGADAFALYRAATRPGFEKNGVGVALFEARIKAIFAAANGPQATVFVTAKRPKFFLDRGFAQISQSDKVFTLMADLTRHGDRLRLTNTLRTPQPETFFIDAPQAKL